MTRRMKGTGRVLSLNGYIHRATLGLTKDERLDAAAELRTHLLERVAEHEAQGFTREEAEYLAVKGMGEPAVTNRELLGHALTHRAGWVVVALLLLGGGSYYTYRELLPPREGIRQSRLTSEDTASLFSAEDAPRTTYSPLALTYPRGTRTVVYATIASTDVKNGPEAVDAFIYSVAEQEAQNFRGRIPGSYRYQQRALITPLYMTCEGRESVGLYAFWRAVRSPFWNSGATVVLEGAGGAVEPCHRPHIPLHQVQEKLSNTPPRVVSRTLPPVEDLMTGADLSNPASQHLRLNHWTVLQRLLVDPLSGIDSAGMPEFGRYSAQTRGVYLAVMPLDRTIKGDGSYSWGGGFLKLSGDDHPLPKLPPIVPQPLP